MTRWIFAASIAALAIPAALLAQEDAVPLEGLVVTGSATPRPADALATHVTVLQGSELRAAGITRVQDALRTVAGLSMVQNGSMGAATSLFMRGGESDYVLVLVDGVQVNQPGGSFDFAGLTTDNVERIEILRGPASALYGSDAVAGVVHVITGTGGDGQRASLSARAGGYGTREFSGTVQGGDGGAGYAVSLSRRHTDGILPVNNDFTNTVLAASGRFSPDGDTRLRLSMRLADRAYHFPTDGSGAGTDVNAFTYGDESVIGLTVDRRITGTLALAANLGVSELDGGTDDAQDGVADTLGYYGFTSLDHVRRSTADVRANLALPVATVTLGGEVEEERQRSFTSTRSQYGDGADRSENSRWNRAVYGQVVGEQAAVAFNAGGRVEDNERFGNLVTWQLGTRVRVDALGGVLLRASAGRGIKAPTFYENFATGFALGNPDLRPEESESWEVGVEGSLASGTVHLVGSYFSQRFDNLIQYTFAPANPGDPNFFNVAAASARGVELSAELASGPWSLSGSWTHLTTEVVDAGFDEGPGAAFVEGASLLRRPDNAVSLSGGLSLAGAGSFTAALDWVGAREDRDFATYPAQRVSLPAHALLGLGAVVPLRGTEADGGVELTFRAENLLDADYEEVLGYAAPGRRLLVGVTVRMGG